MRPVVNRPGRAGTWKGMLGNERHFQNVSEPKCCTNITNMIPPLAAKQSEHGATNMELHEKDNETKCSHVTLHDKPAFSLSLQTQETKPLTNARVADSR